MTNSPEMCEFASERHPTRDFRRLVLSHWDHQGDCRRKIYGVESGKFWGAFDIVRLAYIQAAQPLLSVEKDYDRIWNYDLTR